MSDVNELNRQPAKSYEPKPGGNKMEQNKSVIEALNKALSLEWAGSIQYLQHSFLVHGLYREVY